MKFLDEFWFLVRRTDKEIWHQVKDDASGTADNYGIDSINEGNLLLSQTCSHSFGIRYYSYNWNKILFSSGDLSRYAVMSRAVLDI